MMRFLLVFFGMFSQLGVSLSQDIIFSEDGEELKTRVLEVGKKSILYKDFDDPDFTTRIIPVNKVSKIRFEDGTEKNFNNNQLKHYLGITAYGCNPVGDFGTDNTNNEFAGYANEGSGWKLDFGYYIFKNFGFNATIGGASNGLNTDRLSDPFRGGMNTIEIGPNEENEKVEYRNAYFLIGPMYSLKLGRKFAFDFKLSAGIVGLKRTSFHIRGDSPLNSFFISYEPMRGTALGISPGIAVRFNLLNWLGLRLSSDFILANPRLSGRTVISQSNGGPVDTRELRDSFVQKYQVANVGLALIFMFKR